MAGSRLLPCLYIGWLCHSAGSSGMRSKARRSGAGQCLYAGTGTGRHPWRWRGPVLVDIDDNYHINLDDLESKAASSQAKFLLLSHMRGHIADMDRVTELCQKYRVCLIEDCAHTMGRNGVANDRVTLAQLPPFPPKPTNI